MTTEELSTIKSNTAAMFIIGAAMVCLFYMIGKNHNMEKEVKLPLTVSKMVFLLGFFDMMLLSFVN